MKELREKLVAALKAAREIAAKAEAEKRDFTAEERQKVAGYIKEAADLKAQLKQAKDDDDLRRQLDAMGFGIDLEGGNGGDGASVPAGKGVSLGERFVTSDAWKQFMTQFPGGRVSEKARVTSPPVEFKDLLTGSDADSAGAFVQTDYTGIYEPLGRYPLNVLSLIQRRRTTSDLVEFVRQTTKVQQAAPTAEANVTDYTGASGEVEGAKPEGTTEFEKVQAAVKTIAVWLPATKRALSDAAQIRGIIDQELRDDLMEELEDQALNGDGDGENFTGVINTTGILEQAWDTDLVTTARKAITTLDVTGLSQPTAWVLHPSDWEAIELLKDGNDRFYWGGPLGQGRKTLWGVPVVTSHAMDEGEALLGDWRKAILWDREMATIQVSDSHEDFFTRNMVAILAEMRAAFGVIRPSAFVKVALESGS